MRKPSKPHTFEQRLEEQRIRLESQLAELPHGGPREVVAARLEQLRTAAEMYEFLSPRTRSGLVAERARLDSDHGA